MFGDTLGVSTNYNSKNYLKINFAILFFFSLYLFNNALRTTVLYELSFYNIPFFITSFLYIIFSFKKGNINYLLFYMILSLSIFISLEYVFLWKHPISFLIMSIISLFLPLLMTAIIIDRESIMQGFLKFLKFYNSLIIILLIFGVIDYISGSKIQLYLANNFFKESQLSQLIMTEYYYYGIYRYYSFLGHPLTNANYFLVFIVLNNIYSKINKKYIISKYLIILISLFGLILSGSKTGIVLGILANLLMIDIKRNKFVLLFIVLVATLFYFSPLFQQNLLARFVEGIETGDITTGRNTLLTDLIRYGKEKPGIFIGGGVDYSREVAINLGGGITNFEYPAIMLAYDYGIVVTIIIYLIIFIIPIVRMLYNREYFIAINFLLISVMVNTNNGIANLGSDALAQLCFLIFLFNNLVNRNLKTNNA
ncbi:hypothetical protein RI196_17300 [Aeribacillus composti]|uniref:O-antigen ligase-like membrane protein n=1 Tax=Aeribacillus composti TaxID=1868734 RepID=A0ABY9WBT3_9BACI|nr:hypothetical protein [Aeribacillus composti]WNF32954.1 hypothetical protein RI196_17300 [Aeribacillus composti]